MKLVYTHTNNKGKIMTNKIILLTAFIAAALQGDYLMKYNMSGETNTFLYKDDNHAKVIINKEGSSKIYSLNKKTYIVSDQDGVLSIIDTQKAKGFIQSMGISVVNESEEENQMPEFKITKTGKKELVGGIQGDVWILSLDGKQSEVVVTNNKNVLKMTQKMMDLLTQMGTKGKNFFEIEKGYVVIKGDEFRLEEFASKTVPKSEYALPKKASSKRVVKRKEYQTYTPPVAKKAEVKKESPSDSISKEDIDKAANMLKSFF